MSSAKRPHPTGKSDQDEGDVYTMGEWDQYPGARPRTRPGQAPGEEIYDQIRDVNGRLVTNKPSNKAMLTAQRARLEHQRRVEADTLARAQRRAQRKSSSSSSLRFSWTTIFMITLFIPLFSHFLTGSYDFHLTPHLKKNWKKSVINPWKPKLKHFSMQELSKHDGREEEQVWVAIGGEVFDVSANRRIYGKGGSYNMMAGRDASRAFTTGCFQTHLTHDIRGLTKDQLQALDNWKKFFFNHEKYVHIGHVDLPPIDPSSPIPGPCKAEPAPGESNGAESTLPVGAQGPHQRPANANPRRKIHAGRDH